MSWSQWRHEEEENALWGRQGADSGLGWAGGPREQEGGQSEAGEDPLPPQSLETPQSEAGENHPPPQSLEMSQSEAGPLTTQSLGAPPSEAGEETLWSGWPGQPGLTP